MEFFFKSLAINKTIQALSIVIFTFLIFHYDHQVKTVFKNSKKKWNNNFQDLSKSNKYPIYKIKKFYYNKTKFSRNSNANSKRILFYYIYSRGVANSILLYF